MLHFTRTASTRECGSSLEITTGYGSASTRSGHKVLLADHSRLADDKVSAILNGASHTLVRVKSVEQTVSLVSDGSVDLVLAGGRIGDLCATELCRLLKRSAATQLLPTFVLWPGGDSDGEARAIEA